MKNRLRRLFGLQPVPKKCCLKRDNLVARKPFEGMIIHTCKICGCRHFEVTAEPGKLGVKL